jgi:hypothetical protein
LSRRDAKSLAFGGGGVYSNIVKLAPINGNVPRKKKMQSNLISSGRWAAYSAAGVASAVALASSTEAEVHYSGLVNYEFASHGGQGTFPLDPGVNLAMSIGVPGSSDAFGHVFINGANGAFVGRLGIYTSPFASSLAAGLKLSHQLFAVSCRWSSSNQTNVCYYSGDNIGDGNFETRGRTFLGFRFFNESGVHFGWARVRLSGAPKYRFELVDYAWADAGEGLRTGQKTSLAQSAAITKSGSLGLLATGAAGLKAWRAENSGRPLTR